MIPRSSNSSSRRKFFIWLAFLAVVLATAALDLQAQTKPKGKDPFQKISFESKKVCTVESSGEVTSLVKSGVELSVTEDWDCDGVADAYDNCVGMPNPSQADTNDNGIGDACEAATGVKLGLPAKPAPAPSKAAPAKLSPAKSAPAKPAPMKPAPSKLSPVKPKSNEKTKEKKPDAKEKKPSPKDKVKEKNLKTKERKLTSKEKAKDRNSKDKEKKPKAKEKKPEAAKPDRRTRSRSGKR